MNTLRDRTKAFALRVIHVYSSLPQTELARILGRQLVRSGTSPGAQCREGYRARSNAEIISKYETALQELEETLYWLELIIDTAMVPPERLQPLMAEANEIMAILVSSVRTIKRRRR